MGTSFPVATCRQHLTCLCWRCSLFPTVYLWHLCMDRNWWGCSSLLICVYLLWVRQYHARFFACLFVCDKISLCRPGWPPVHKDLCVCLPSDTCHHAKPSCLHRYHCCGFVLYIEVRRGNVSASLFFWLKIALAI